MSPLKRGLCVDVTVPVKRLRGGGEDEPDDLFVEDDIMDSDDFQEPPEEILADIDVPKILEGEYVTRWSRPPVPPDLNNKVDLNVQWLDMDVISGDPLQANPNITRNEIVGASDGKVPILRAYGVSEAGNSVTIFIHGFTPYGYFALPPEYEIKDMEFLADIREVLHERLKTSCPKHAQEYAAVLGVSYLDGHKSIMGYETIHTRFLKVMVSLPGLVPTLKGIMEGGIMLPGVVPTGSSSSNRMAPCFLPFECNVPFVLRFMVDRDISGAGWLTLPSDRYQIRGASEKKTHCQVSI